MNLLYVLRKAQFYSFTVAPFKTKIEFLSNQLRVGQALALSDVLKLTIPPLSINITRAHYQHAPLIKFVRGDAVGIGCVTALCQSVILTDF